MAVTNKEVRLVMAEPDLTAEARLLWIDMLSQAPGFVHHRSRSKTLLARSDNKLDDIWRELVQYGAARSRGRDKEGCFLPGYTCTRPQDLGMRQDRPKPHKKGTGTSSTKPQKSNPRRMGSLIRKAYRETAAQNVRLPDRPELIGELSVIFKLIDSVIDFERSHFYLKIALQEFDWREIRAGALRYAENVRSRPVKKQVASLENWLRDGRWLTVIDDSDTETVAALRKAASS